MNEKELLRLLEEYYHYKFMTSGFWDYLFSRQMNLEDFMRWLKSRSN